jgi:ParB family transcriptional regulator, chromosome partitioning protein
MQSTEETILLERINLEDKTFQITTEASIETLTRSIVRLGVIHPPVLLAGVSGYRIISCFRRIFSCKALGLSTISAKLLEPGTDQRVSVQLAIADNSLQRPLNLIETSRALVLLSGIFSDPKELCIAAGVLGLPDNLSVVHKLQQLSNLAPAIQNGVLSGILSLAMALELGQMENPSGIELATLFGNLKLGLNKQRDILVLIQEIAHREHFSVEDVLSTPALQQILSHEKWDRSQKTVHLRQYLRCRRYPSITAAENDFKARVQSLNLESGIVLIPPRDFEGTTFSVQLNFNKLSELQRHISSLTEVSSSPILNEMLIGSRISPESS